MTAYATIADIELELAKTFTSAEKPRIAAKLNEAAAIIDAYNSSATEDVKKIVTCRMLVRALGTTYDDSVPMGATQGSMSALGYSQSWTMGGGGGVGELYLGKTEKKLLGAGNAIGSYSPVQCLAGVSQ